MFSLYDLPRTVLGIYDIYIIPMYAVARCYYIVENLAAINGAELSSIG